MKRVHQGFREWLVAWGNNDHLQIQTLQTTLNSLRPSDAFMRQTPSVNWTSLVRINNGLSSGRWQAIIWTNAGILLIGPLGTNFSGILFEYHRFSFKKIHYAVWKMAAILSRPQCLNPLEPKPLLELIQIYCYLAFKEYILAKYKSKYTSLLSSELNWKCHLQNFSHSVQGRWVDTQATSYSLCH